MNRDPRLYKFFLEEEEDIQSFNSLDSNDTLSFSSVDTYDNKNKSEKNIFIGGTLKGHDNETFKKSCQNHLKKKENKKNYKNVTLFGFNFIKI